MQLTALAPTNHTFLSGSVSYDWLRHFVRNMLQARRERRQLRGLDGRTLSDLGLTKDMALREADRMPWDLPARFDAELSARR